MQASTRLRHPLPLSGPGLGVQRLICRPCRTATGGALRAYTPRQDPAARMSNNYQPYTPGSWQPQQSSTSGSPNGSYMGRSEMVGGPSPTMGGLVKQDSGAAALKSKDTPKTCRVRFWLKFHVDYGQSIKIIGSHQDLGGWNLAKSPGLKWSEGDLWNVSMELQAGTVYEYKYVVIEQATGQPVSWQTGGNNVLGLQLNDSELEVYDNWRNTPGAMVLVDGVETTRERKLLEWAQDMNVQRTELRRTRMELAQAREEIRVLRAELSVLRMEVSEASVARGDAEARSMELERENTALKLEVASGAAQARTTMEEAVRLLSSMSDAEDTSNTTAAAATTSSRSSNGGGSSSNSKNGGSSGGSGVRPNGTAMASATASGGGGSSSSSNGNGATASASGGGVFGGLFGFGAPLGRVPAKPQTLTAPGAGVEGGLRNPDGRLAPKSMGSIQGGAVAAGAVVAAAAASSSSAATEGSTGSSSIYGAGASSSGSSSSGEGRLGVSGSHRAV